MVQVVPTSSLKAIGSSGVMSLPGSRPPTRRLRGSSSLATAAPYTDRMLSRREAVASVLMSVRDSP